MRAVTMDELVEALPDTPCLFTSEVAEFLELAASSEDVEPATLARVAHLLHRGRDQGRVQVVYSNPNGPMWGRT